MNRRWLLALLVCPASLCADEPLPDGLRVFTCGHSFHVWVVPMLTDIAGAAGIQNHRVAGVSAIGGSRVVQHWNVPDDMNQAKRQLAAGNVDVLTLAPIWLPDEGIENFARLGFEHNPNIRVLVQEFWLPNDTYNPVYPLETRKSVDHNAATIAELRKQNDRYRQDLEGHLQELNRKLGKEVLFAVPVGEATIALREKILERKAPGLKVQWRLFADDWGHPTPPLKVLAAYCNYGVIYRRSPVGLPLPQELERNKEFANAALNRLLQELAWDAVSKHPMTGLAAK